MRLSGIKFNDIFFFFMMMMKKVLHFTFMNFTLLKHLTHSSHKVLSASLTNSDLSPTSIHTTGLGEFD